MSAGKSPPHRVIVTAEAVALLESITLRDRRIAAKLAELMEDLSLVGVGDPDTWGGRAADPEPRLKGSHLRGEFAGLLSRHCLGNRFRIIYRIDATHHTVTIVSLGIRKAGDTKDVYELTKKIMRRLRR